MPFTLRLSEIDSSVKDRASRLSEWDIEIAAGEKLSRARLSDPFADSEAFGKEPETAVRWYLEKYTTEPFQTTKAELAAEALSAYGHKLAAQIVRCGLLPTNGDIELEIKASDRHRSLGTQSTYCERRDLQQLHWEVLEDVRVWPPSYSFESVSVFRTSRRTFGTVSRSGGSPKGNRLRVLLVVSRPGQDTDLDYQLVSRFLVAIIGHVSKTIPGANASLKILRPPTWQAFQEHLREHEYDLVHLDMHGELKDVQKGTTTAVLAFCRQSLRDPLWMKKDFKTGDEIGKELAKAGVKTVILNACNSASFQDHIGGGNLAEVLLGHGVESVLAMAYNVVEEAVAIFMNVFYQSLLIEGVSVQEAARISRLALRKNRSRRALYMHNVQLSDYVVPVLYTSSPTTDTVRASTNLESRGTISSYLEDVLTSIKYVLPMKRETGNTMTPMRRELTGRDSDVLSLELLLSITRVILLHGQGGCGKSELLRYVCLWWKASGWIEGSVYIDFADKKGYTLEDFVEQIGHQLGITPGNRLEDDVIGKLKSRKYLLVFDSVDALDTPVSLDLVTTSAELPMRLKSFIDAATRDESMVIVSSRQSTVEIANIIYPHQKYLLTGISVRDSVDLLLNLALEPQTRPPETFHRRANIDYLRRVAILLEGNPGAIQMVVPALRRANYDGETLLTSLLYGVWKMDDGEWERCRFVRSIFSASLAQSFINVDETLVTVGHLAMFWTLMPQNLDYYYWFLYLSCSPSHREGSFGYWITQDFQELVRKAPTGSTLRKHWPGIESKLLRAGILEHAIVRMDTGEQTACYHVHPILTLIGRSYLSEDAVREAKFAYVRQILLWDKHPDGPSAGRFVSVEWNGTEQNEDYVHNLRAVAMAWSLDGDVSEEVDRMGLSMFDCTYTMSIPSLYVNKRQPVLFIPLIWSHLLKIHMLVTLIRPSGVPTPSDLGAILSYSYEVYRFQTDDSGRLPLVTTALDAAERYRISGPSGTRLSPPKELSWFQLRHAEANIAESNSTIARAKELYERNLADDPSSGNSKMYNDIRRCQLQNLTNWANCVARISARGCAFDMERASTGLREFCGGFKAGYMAQSLPRIWNENEKVLETMTVGDQFLGAIKKERDKVSKFGALAKSIINEPMVNVFADWTKAQGLPPGKMFSALSQTTDMQKTELRAMFSSAESALRMLSGDMGGAASALEFNLQREALSSTTSTGWENLSDIHMEMYALAVMRNNEPDYKMGLTHLEEWWKQHRGINVAKRDICCGYLEFATCYNGLNRVTEAARAVIRCARIVPTMTTADCADGDNVAGFSEWLYEQFASFDKLGIFQDPATIISVPPTVSKLPWQERIAIHQIMKKAHEVKKASEGCNEVYNALVETFRDTLKIQREHFKKDGEQNVRLDDMEKWLDGMIKMKPKMRHLGDKWVL